tara:strand:+ start:9008 stop:9370 length:363 start_codon:yes stop_codon:yes gene_type:complete
MIPERKKQDYAEITLGREYNHLLDKFLLENNMKLLESKYYEDNVQLMTYDNDKLSITLEFHSEQRGILAKLSKFFGASNNDTYIWISAITSDIGAEFRDNLSQYLDRQNIEHYVTPIFRK